MGQSWFSALFGYGFSSEQFNLIENYFFSSLMKRSVDSYWLVNLLRYGWPMFFFLGLLTFSVIKQNLYQSQRVRKIKTHKNLLEAWLIVMLGITLIGFSVHFWSSMLSIYMVVLACTCTSLNPPKKHK